MLGAAGLPVRFYALVICILDFSRVLDKGTVQDCHSRIAFHGQITLLFNNRFHQKRSALHTVLLLNFGIKLEISALPKLPTKY